MPTPTPVPPHVLPASEGNLSWDSEGVEGALIRSVLNSNKGDIKTVLQRECGLGAYSTKVTPLPSTLMVDTPTCQTRPLSRTAQGLGVVSGQTLKSRGGGPQILTQVGPRGLPFSQTAQENALQVVLKAAGRRSAVR